MQIENVFQASANLPEPVLTAYLNTAGNDASRHPRVQACLAWLRDNTEPIRRTLSHRDAKQFERQVRRVCQFLEDRRPAERALVIFAGLKTWKVIPLQIPVSNELHWGKPKIAALLPLLHGHRRYGVVVVDHTAARFFEFAYGQLTLAATKPFEIDASQWKRREQGRVAIESVQNSRGPVRDLYQHRIEAQYKRLCHQLGEEATALSKSKELDGLFLVGPDRLIQAVQEKIPHFLAASTVFVGENLGQTSARELQRRLQPLIDCYEQEQQLSIVKRLASSRGALTTPDEVLAQLQTHCARKSNACGQLDRAGFAVVVGQRGHSRGCAPAHNTRKRLHRSPAVCGGSLVFCSGDFDDEKQPGCGLPLQC
jgi:hypothetical protein